MICYCNQVTEEEIRQSIKDGAKTVDDITHATKACGIGCCYSKVLQILKDETKEEINK